MIVDYNSLKDAVADHLARSDLTNVIPTLIHLAEVKLDRELKTYQRLVVVSGNAVARLIELPATFREVVGLAVNVGGRYLPLHPRPAEDLAQDLGAPAGNPTGYVLTQSGIHLLGAPDGAAYTMRYYRSIPALSDSAQQNWLILEAPDLYLYGALAESAPYLKEDARIPVWRGAYTLELQHLRHQDFSARFRNARQRPDCMVP